MNYMEVFLDTKQLGGHHKEGNHICVTCNEETRKILTLLRGLILNSKQWFSELNPNYLAYE